MNTKIKLSNHEVQSGLSRVGSAEGLIQQLPKDHDGRNTWLMNYGTRQEARELRANDAQKAKDDNRVPRELVWNNETECLDSAS